MKKNQKNWISPLIGLAGLMIVSLALALISTRGAGLQGWASFFAVLALCSGGFWLAVRYTGKSVPRSILFLTIGAIFLRLVLGAIWFTGVPEWGHDNEVQNAGYIYEDAYGRDTHAWELSQSDSSLFEAFQGYSHKDQYGGMLFLSAAIYRFIGADYHQPLLIVVLTAFAGGLTIWFTWLALEKGFGSKQAVWAAWLLALFPEVVFLSSSQMREPLLMLLASAALAGLYYLDEGSGWKQWVKVVLPVLCAIPISVPMSVLIALSLVLIWLGKNEWRLLSDKRIRAILIAGIILVLVLIFIPQIGGKFINQMGNYQEYLTERSSGWVQKLFDQMPEWLHLPFIIGYGVVRPLLPAAVFDDGLLFWKSVEIWRSLGWTAFLGGLLYGSYLAIRRGQWKKHIGVIFAVVWIMIIVAAYRGGGDAWDNPRYRAVFAGFQSLALAWTVIEYQRKPEPWLKRIIVLAGITIAVVSLWYAHRYLYFPWFLTEPIQNIVFAVILSAVFWAWDIYKTRSI